jgi:Mannose-1-phosphate guanylyltransferase
LQELEKFDSEMFNLTKKAYEKAKVTQEAIALQKASFEKIKGNSIDYAVMEHTQNAVVIPLDAGWSDVGSWDMVWELSEKDHEGNANKSDKVKPFYADASGNLIHTQKNRPVALLGIKDCVIIESPQGLLIADKSYMQEVKAAAENFKN